MSLFDSTPITNAVADIKQTPVFKKISEQWNDFSQSPSFLRMVAYLLTLAFIFKKAEDVFTFSYLRSFVTVCLLFTSAMASGALLKARESTHETKWIAGLLFFCLCAIAPTRWMISQQMSSDAAQAEFFPVYRSVLFQLRAEALQRQERDLLPSRHFESRFISFQETHLLPTSALEWTPTYPSRASRARLSR